MQRERDCKEPAGRKQRRGASLGRLYNAKALRAEGRNLLVVVEGCPDLRTARERLLSRARQLMFDTFSGRVSPPPHELIRVRDCELAFSVVLSGRADGRTGFSVAQALWDVAEGRPREDLKPGFYAEMVQWIRGLEGRATFQFAGLPGVSRDLSGREAAVARSAELDKLWDVVAERMGRFADGLSPDASARRSARKRRVLEALGGTEADWDNWRWHARHVVTDAETLARLVPISRRQCDAITRARKGRLPFGVTPYYASLMDDDGSDRDRAIRAQVIPPDDYVDFMLEHRGQLERSCDFMLESDTSPVELITRRYPAIVILKPYNSCPQICVYCQRNWEIEQAMAPGAMASHEEMETAVRWIAEHPGVREVLITGGDPLVIGDGKLKWLMELLAGIEHVDLIRIGTRTPVTMPMRITEELAAMLGGFRELGRREVAVVTHCEHPYEVTMDMARAVDRLRRAGIGVYNQQVYTFYVSRRFESALLRILLRRIGVDPYYTFAPKGKEETASYRVPLARILQEQKEEARLVPGLRRTDEAVYNVPGLGKNYLRAVQHRDLLTVLPDGARVYEFHPWEKNVVECETYLATDVPILDYLQRLADVGEDPDDYASIWYYF